MDDMGWGDLGVNGQIHRETPNIDKVRIPIFTKVVFFSLWFVFLMVGLNDSFGSDSAWRQYRDDGHREEAPFFSFCPSQSWLDSSGKF